jgi:hypothetical protein
MRPRIGTPVCAVNRAKLGLCWLGATSRVSRLQQVTSASPTRAFSRKVARADGMYSACRRMWTRPIVSTRRRFSISNQRVLDARRRPPCWWLVKARHGYNGTVPALVRRNLCIPEAGLGALLVLVAGISATTATNCFDAVLRGRVPAKKTVGCVDTQGESSRGRGNLMSEFGALEDRVGTKPTRHGKLPTAPR